MWSSSLCGRTALVRSTCWSSRTWALKAHSSTLIPLPSTTDTPAPGDTEEELVHVTGSVKRKPVITRPVSRQKGAIKYQERKKHKVWKEAQEGIFAGQQDKEPIIKCRVAERNHHLSQTYSKYKPLPLATANWESRRSIGDFFYFTGRGRPSYGKRKEVSAFEDFALDARLLDNLRENGFTAPTQIQEKAIPSLLQGESSVVASETGNGKTLAFLIPMLQQVLALKESATAERKLNSPLGLVLTPGKELAIQTYNVAKILSHNLDIKVRLEIGKPEISMKHHILRGAMEPTDILIGSFGTINHMTQERFYDFSNTHHLVLDEADTLLDDTFSEETLHFLMRIRNHQGFQISFVGATFPNEVHELFKDLFPSEKLSLVETNLLHSVLPHVRQYFLRTPKVGRQEYIIKTIQKDLERKWPILIFSNKATTSNFIRHYLTEQGIPCCSFNSHRDFVARNRDYNRFLSGEVNVLSCTDLASRGLDTVNVRHVLNYDFPLNVTDYLHRVGRVGRVGSHARAQVSNFISNRIQLDVVRQLEESLRRNRNIKDVEGNVKKIIRRYASSK